MQSSQDKVRQHSRTREKDKTIKNGTDQKVKKGRPKRLQPNTINIQTATFRNNKKQALYNSVYDLLLDFCCEIGAPKGFVFSKQERIIFNNKKIASCHDVKWTEEHEFNISNEENKLDILMAKSKVDWKNQEGKEIADIILNSGGFFAQQFTNEYFLMCIKIYEILKQLQRLKKQGNNEKVDIQNYLKPKLNELAMQICNNETDEYYLLSLKFKNEGKRQKRNETKEERQKKVIRKEKGYQQLVAKLAKQFQQHIK